MNRSRKSKTKFLCRFGTVVALVAWVAASSYCSAEFFFSHLGIGAGHHHHHDDDGSHHQHAATTHHEDSDHHDSNPNESHGDSCCKSLKAVSQSATSFQFTKLAFQKLFALTPLFLTQATASALSESGPPRQAKSSEWVFTPEVSLGPAHRSHGPPAIT